MSHLTQIMVPYELAVRHLKIRDSYDWHQRVWQAFHGRDGETRDFLTRLDEADDAYRLLIVSPSEPTKPNWCPTDCFRTKRIPDDFFTNGRFQFSLRVNPTKKLVVRGPDGERKKNGKRIPLTKREDLLLWIERKALEGGFNIGDPESLRTIPKPRAYFQRGTTQGVHHGVEFQGVLTVTDPMLFRTTFMTGIGSAKAFGFGLLALAPFPTND
jgi:CRISPR system Cascade subunit CasE